MVQSRLEMILAIHLFLASEFRSLHGLAQIGDNTGTRQRFGTADSLGQKLSRESGGWRDFAAKVKYSHPLLESYLILHRGTPSFRDLIVTSRSSTKGSGEGR